MASTDVKACFQLQVGLLEEEVELCPSRNQSVSHTTYFKRRHTMISIKPFLLQAAGKPDLASLLGSGKPGYIIHKIRPVPGRGPGKENGEGECIGRQSRLMLWPHCQAMNDGSGEDWARSPPPPRQPTFSSPASDSGAIWRCRVWGMNEAQRG